MQIFVVSNRTDDEDTTTRIDEIEFWGTLNEYVLESDLMLHLTEYFVLSAPKNLSGLKQDDEE